MRLSLFNTLTRKREAFSPLDANLVKMYVCGPTVYDRPHIGNARSAVVYDILYRVLMQLYGKQNVLYVRNITDIDDKIMDRASRLGIPISSLTAETIVGYNDDMEYLGCLTPTKEPKATEHIAEMIDIIQKLVEAGAAYEAGGNIYFNVSSSKNYTGLSGRTIEELYSGVRIGLDGNKKNPADFVLWKAAGKNDDESAKFASPFGIGRPGWHIECSAMSNKFLGDTFDIHGGGIDLIFPHHTNEIAQSCAAFPDSGYARYWVHNGFLTVNREKMSKSLGNFITVRELIEQQIKGDAARLLLLSAHYRKPLDYNKKALEDAKKMLDYWYRAIESSGAENQTFLTAEAIPAEFMDSLLDDLNIPGAIKLINDFAKEVHIAKIEKVKIEAAKKMAVCAKFLGFMRQSTSQWLGGDDADEEVSRLIAQRAEAKRRNDWQLADQIRSELAKRKIIIEDRADGSSVWKKL